MASGHGGFGVPKLGMEPIRRDALVKATIAEIGTSGHLDVTVAQIARRAGMSTALAHHYFGGKAQIFLAAMRHLLAGYAGEVRAALAGRQDPRDRLVALVGANFTPSNFRQETVRAWLNFYVLAESDAEARRLVAVYHRRLHSNLMHELRRIRPDRAEPVARHLAALIDGVYLREALAGRPADGEGAARLVLSALEAEIGAQP